MGLMKGGMHWIGLYCPCAFWQKPAGHCNFMRELQYTLLNFNPDSRKAHLGFAKTSVTSKAQYATFLPLLCGVAQTRSCVQLRQLQRQNSRVECGSFLAPIVAEAALPSSLDKNPETKKVGRINTPFFVEEEINDWSEERASTELAGQSRSLRLETARLTRLGTASSLERAAKRLGGTTLFAATTLVWVA